MSEFESNNWARNVLRIFIVIFLFWTVLIISLAIWNCSRFTTQATNNLLSKTRSFHNLIVTTRLWNASHGGIYVPVTEKTSPNPYLSVPDREIETDNGQKLTLINPAYMTRQIAELAARQNNVNFHITSLKPIRPENKPEQWEKEMLSGFTVDNEEQYKWLKEEKTGNKYFRYMKALWTNEACLKCHAKQGYKVGDLRGGISVTISVDDTLVELDRNILQVRVAHFFIWLLGLIGLLLAYRIIKSDLIERENLLARLYDSLKEIKTLRGFIPICSSCKNIRNDAGAWEAIEGYIREHSDAEFTHGICPDCREKLYPDIANTKKR